MAPSSPTPNITYQFAAGTTHVVTSYIVGSANDVPERDPKDWRLEASNDGTVWDTVDAQTAQAFASRNSLSTYFVSNMKAYDRYRLNVTASNGATLCQISEFQLFGY